MVIGVIIRILKDSYLFEGLLLFSKIYEIKQKLDTDVKLLVFNILCILLNGL